ncbi:MAG: hypothetical protein ACTH3D_04675, partial [Halomonas sp.]|uniref:hypothetical protein n=1 Tax=Halomonas sp. TaxID=1486246 RepID=UPI003F8DB2C4
YPGPAQGANSTPNDEEPFFSFVRNRESWVEGIIVRDFHALYFIYITTFRYILSDNGQTWC